MRSTVNRLGHVGLTFVCLVALGVLLAAGVSKPLGYRVLIDYSDSMLPTIAAGDVVVTKLVPAAHARPGDVVSFQDPARQGRLLTHRVVSRRAKLGSFDFVTRGDANTGVERWSIDDEGRIGVMVGRAPKLGFALHWLKGPFAGIGLVLLSGVLLAGMLIRRVLAL